MKHKDMTPTPIKNARGSNHPYVHVPPSYLENRQDFNYFNGNADIIFIDSPSPLTYKYSHNIICVKKKILPHNSIYIFYIVFNTKTIKSILTYKCFNVIS